MERRLAFALASLVVSAAAVAAFGVALVHSERLTPPGHVHSGLVQGDMPTYLCYARATLRTATQLHYASPHDVRDDAPPLLVNLPISLMGVLLQLGLDEREVAWALRAVFGTAMLWLAMLLAARAVRDGPLRWAAALTVSLGAGVAWMEAWWKSGSDPSWDSLRGTIGALEAEYQWWFLDTFRNLTYPLECVYHALVFGMMLALEAGRSRTAVALLAAACLSNPFVGVQAGGTYVVAEGLRFAFGSDATPARRRAWALAALVLVVFVAWYGLVQPLDPALASLQRQHAGTLAEPLSWKGLLRGHGPAAFVGLTLLDARFRRRVLGDASLRPLFALGVTTLALVEHPHLTSLVRLMPMHFTRGYLHLAAWLLLFAWMAHRLAPRLGPRPRLLPALALAVPLLLSVDNVAFVQARATELPQRPHLVWSDATEAVLAHLRALPGSSRVLVHEEALGRNVCAFTPHRSVFGTPLTTPFHFERDEQMRAWNATPTTLPPVVESTHVLVLPPGRRRWGEALVAQGWRLTLTTREWLVYERDRPPAPLDAVPTATSDH